MNHGLTTPVSPQTTTPSARKIRLLVASVLSVGVLGLFFTAFEATAATQTVHQKNTQFDPANLTVNVGDTVTWTNDESDGTIHSSVSDDNLWNSPDMPPGSTFSYTFTQPGTFGVHCRFHPSMTGTITVNGGGGGGGGAPAPAPTTTQPAPPPPAPAPTSEQPPAPTSQPTEQPPAPPTSEPTGAPAPTGLPLPDGLPLPSDLPVPGGLSVPGLPDLGGLPLPAATPTSVLARSAS